MIFGKPPDHLIKVATLIKDFWRLWGAWLSHWGGSILVTIARIRRLLTGCSELPAGTAEPWETGPGREVEAEARSAARAFFLGRPLALGSAFFASSFLFLFSSFLSAAFCCSTALIVSCLRRRSPSSMLGWCKASSTVARASDKSFCTSQDNSVFTVARPLWAGACQKHRGWKTCYKGKKSTRINAKWQRPCLHRFEFHRNGLCHIFPAAAFTPLPQRFLCNHLSCSHCIRLSALLLLFQPQWRSTCESCLLMVGW